MSTILTSAIIQGAKDSVDNYVTQITALNGQLDGIMKTLTSTNFTGDASVGYNDFYTQKVLPAITDNLTQQGNSLTASIKSMLDNIQQQLLSTVDTQLGENNRNPGGAASAASNAVAGAVAGATAAVSN